MLLLSRVAGVLRCSTHTAKRIGCRRREVRSTTTAAAAATTTTGDGHGKGAAATGKSDGDDPHKHNILLYEAGSKRLLRISSATAVMNGFFWSFYVGVLEAQLPSTTWEPWGYVGLGCTALMFGVSHTFANHWISKVSYFPAYRLLSIGTHTFFGKERVPRLVKLGGTVLPAIKPTAVYIPLKVRGDMFFSLLDKDDGVFHNRDFLMKLLKATPGGDVAAHASTANAATPAASKVKQPWKRKRRSR